MHSDPVSYYARLSDGKSAASRDCRVRLDLSGLEIASDDGVVQTRWPYESLRVSEPIRPHSVDVLLSSTSAPGITVFIPGTTVPALLATRSPHLTSGSERWRHARPWIIGAAALIGLGILIHAAGWTPLRTVADLLPHSWRVRLGDSAIQSMAEGKGRCINPVGLAALDRLSQRLSAAAGTGQKFEVVVVDWKLFNAFAVPGDKIIMTRGLIEKAESPDEVAGVLAHEMGHGIAMHPETGIIRAIGMSAALELMMGGSGGTLANLGLVLAQLGYSRAAEREADDQALILLRKSGISQQGLSDFFRRVLKAEKEYDDDEIAENADKKDSSQGKTKTSKHSDDSTKARLTRALDMFSTHPPTAERAEHIRMSGSYPSTPALSAEDWRAFRSICAVSAPLSESSEDN
ncbi:MAG: M48 family metallopeptidase [Hyphomicrobiaceae bacterium]